MKPTRLLRWYPRTWRERYGGELAALIQDDLDEGAAGLAAAAQRDRGGRRLRARP